MERLNDLRAKAQFKMTPLIQRLADAIKEEDQNRRVGQRHPLVILGTRQEPYDVKEGREFKPVRRLYYNQTTTRVQETVRVITRVELPALSKAKRNAARRKAAGQTYDKLFA